MAIESIGDPIFVSGPAGPASAATASALTDVVAALKAFLMSADLPTARAALGLGNVANLAPADLPVSSAAATAIAARLLAGSNLSDLADKVAARTNLGVAIGSNVQAWDVDLDAIAALATQAFGRSLLTGADAASVRALLALGSAALLAAGQPGGAATLDASTGKLTAAQIPDSLLGALRYQGGWNASTNTPALPAPSAANKGFYYIVLTAGTTSLTGPSGSIADWQVGDWAVSDGTYWEKVDSSDQVVSVAGLQGAIPAAALKTALAVGSADIVDATSLGRTLLTGVSTSAVLAAIGGAARGANTDITSLAGLTTPLTAGQGGTGYASLSAALDGVFGAARGTILVRGVSAWTALALGASGYTLQSNGTDLVFAASTPGTGALRYDTGQTLSAAQQRQALANAGAAASPKRQTVQSGPAASGAPNFLPASTSGTLALAFQNVSSASPLILSGAKGSDAAGAIDQVAIFTANPSVTLPASSTAYIYYDFDAAAWSSSTLAPIYQFGTAGGAAISTANGQYTFDYSPGGMVGWVGNGTSAVRANRVYVGRAVTSPSAVTATVAYAYNGSYDSGWTATLPGGSTLTTRSHNLGVQPGRKLLIAECTTADAGYAVGDQIDTLSGLATNPNNFAIAPGMPGTSEAISVATSNFGAWIVINKSSFGASNLTAASWKWRILAQRDW